MFSLDRFIYWGCLFVPVFSPVSLGKSGWTGGGVPADLEGSAHTPERICACAHVFL